MASRLSKDILFTYFSGHATALQKKLIEAWLREPENFERYYEWLEEWEQSRPHFLPDTDRAWKKSRERIDDDVSESVERLSSPVPALRRVPLLRKSWKVAVCLLAVCLGAYMLSDRVIYRWYHTAYGELRTITLEDNSLVILNSNSVLRVPRWGFGPKHRDVLLEGEAEFVIRKTADYKKFTVHTPDHNQVTVLGTEFVVYSRDKGTRVVLNKGKVRLSSRDEARPPLTLLPGEQASISRNGEIEVEKLTEAQLDAHTAWKEHRFVFDRTSLTEVGARLTETFGVKIRIADSLLSGRELTGTFRAQHLDDFLSVLSEMLEIEIHRQDKIVVLTPKRISGD